MMLYSLVLVIPMTWLAAAGYDDLPCAARAYENKSVVCVCTADYCDTVIRETPECGQFYTYTSSLSGDRFNKSCSDLETYAEDDAYDAILTVEYSKKRQTVYGFGGAVTDSAGINWVNLNDSTLKQLFVDSYCSPKGLEYSMLRVPIGGSDFSTHGYGYNLLPENDTYLSNFSLTYEDYNYKLPLIQACMEASNTSINLLAGLWSPPAWMKTNNAYNGFGWLKKEYYQTLADYIYKFYEAYLENGVSFWGMTITNEPINGITNAHNPNSLGWTLDQMGDWLLGNLVPTLRNSSSPFTNIKILANDENRYLIPLYWNLLMRVYPKALDYVDGVAVHWYSDKNVSATIMQKAMEKTPDKFLLYTEACIIPAQMEEYPVVIVDYGSWTRAEKYIKNIIENLNYNSTGWMDWNMALNTAGGPSWLNHKLDSPIIVNETAKEFIKQPLFYAMGHFSKFLPLNSTRVEVTVTSCPESIHQVAYITPTNTTVVILYNESTEEKSVNIVMDTYQASVTIPGKTIKTIEAAI